MEFLLDCKPKYEIVAAFCRLYTMILINHRYQLPSVLVVMFISLCSQAQSITARLNLTQNPPLDLLATRSVVLFDYTYSKSQLEEAQKSFQNIGIDPIAYFEIDKVFAGNDMQKAFSAYFTSRQVKYVVILEKAKDEFLFTTTILGKESDLFDSGQAAWRVSNPRIDNLMLTIWQDTWRSQKKRNFLINDLPETDIFVDPFKGRRGAYYAIDLKVDNLAVIKFGNEQMDKELEQFFIDNYPLKYQIVEAGSNEQELRKQGFHYVLRFVHTRGVIAREVLSYDLSKEEKNYVSITFPTGQLQLKVIPREKVIYKFYFRHIDNGNVFLGTKWDADDTWLDALRNHVLAFKQEARLN